MRMRWIPPLMLAFGLFALPALAADRHPMHESMHSSPASERTVVGDVVSVNAKDRAVTLREGKQELRYTLTPTALVESGGKTVAFSDVKSGEHVRLTVASDSRTASRLEIVPASSYPKKS